MSKQYYLKKGTILDGRYEITEVIGEGGFGITYRGVHKSIGMSVAIKEYFSKNIMDRDTSDSDKVKLTWEDNTAKFEKEKKRFLKEARIISDFSKEKGVVHIMDYFEANNTVYIVMEYIEGESLREFIKKNGAMSVTETINRMLPVINTLGKINNCGVIHRDIGPNNIMVEGNGNFRLIDFGSAKEFENIEEKSYSIVLTGGYAPPEQYDKDGHLGPWTDVYAVCAVIYFAITGYSPQEALSRMLYDELEKPSERGVKIKSELEKVIIKGLSINPKDRYKTMEELEAALIPFVETKKEKDSKSKLKTAGLVAAIAIIVVIGAIFGWNKYYESHKEEIIFGDEPVQHILVEAGDDMSVKEYNHAKNILEKRLDVLTNGKYLLDEEGEKLRIAFARKIASKEELYTKEETGQQFDMFVKSYLTRPVRPYIYNRKDYNNYEYETGIELSYDEIKDIKIKKGKINTLIEEKNEEYSAIKRKVNCYYEIVLTKKFVDKLKINGYGDSLEVIYDGNIKDINPVIDKAYLDYKRRTLYIQTDVHSSNIKKLYKYDVTHKKFSKCFSVLGYDHSVKWEEPDNSFVKSENQVVDNTIDKSYYCFLYECSDYDKEMTDGRYYSSVIDLKKRMDALGTKYCIGRDEDKKEKNIVIKVPKDSIQPYVMKNVIADTYVNFSLANGLFEKEFRDSDGEIAIQTDKGKKKLVISFDTSWKGNFEEWKKFIKKCTDNNLKKIFLKINSIKVAEASLDNILKEGKLVFDHYLVRSEEESSPFSYYYFIKTSLYETTMDGRLVNYHFYSVDKNGLLENEHLITVNESPDNKRRIAKCKKIVKSIDSTANCGILDGSSEEEIIVDFKKVSNKEDDIRKVFNNIKEIVDKCELLNGDYKSVTFRLHNIERTYSLVCIDIDTVNGAFEKRISIDEKSYSKTIIKKCFDEKFENIKWNKSFD